MTTTPAAESRRSSLRSVTGAAWYVGLVLAFAGIVTAIVIGTGAQPTLLAFALALPPALTAIGLAWREGKGAVGRLLRQLTVRPANPMWYLVLLIPLAGFLAVDVVAIALGESPNGMFDAIFPAVLIVPLVVVVPAFAEEVGWRGYALPRTLTVLSPLRAAVVLGIPWAMIHIPLYLPGQMNSGSALWSMVTQLIAYSVILTWIRRRDRRKRAGDRALSYAAQRPDAADERDRPLCGVGHPRHRVPGHRDPGRGAWWVQRHAALDRGCDRQRSASVGGYLGREGSANSRILTTDCLKVGRAAPAVRRSSPSPPASTGAALEAVLGGLGLPRRT